MRASKKKGGDKIELTLSLSLGSGFPWNNAADTGSPQPSHTHTEWKRAIDAARLRADSLSLSSLSILSKIPSLSNNSFAQPSTQKREREEEEGSLRQKAVFRPLARPTEKERRGFKVLFWLKIQNCRNTKRSAAGSTLERRLSFSDNRARPKFGPSQKLWEKLSQAGGVQKTSD